MGFYVDDYSDSSYGVIEQKCYVNIRNTELGFHDSNTGVRTYYFQCVYRVALAKGARPFATKSVRQIVTKEETAYSLSASLYDYIKDTDFNQYTITDDD